MPKPEESQLQFSSVCLTVNTYFSSSENLLLSVNTMISATEQTDVTLPSVDNILIYSTKQAGFALNRTKQLDNLTKDTDIMNYVALALDDFLPRYNFYLNSEDRHDNLLALVKSRAHGGTLALWGKDLYPYITI